MKLGASSEELGRIALRFQRSLLEHAELNPREASSYETEASQKLQLDHEFRFRINFVRRKDDGKSW